MIQGLVPISAGMAVSEPLVNHSFKLMVLYCQGPPCWNHPERNLDSMHYHVGIELFQRAPSPQKGHPLSGPALQLK